MFHKSDSMVCAASYALARGVPLLYLTAKAQAAECCSAVRGIHQQNTEADQSRARQASLAVSSERR